MALQTTIRAYEANIDLTYHRVWGLQYVVNDQNAITVASYYDRDTREQERVNPTVFCQLETFFTDYDPSMTVVQAYEFLKTIEKFKDAIDVLDDGDGDLG